MGIQRVLSSLVLIPVLYLIVWKLPPVYFVGLVLLAAGIGQYEFYRMARMRGIRPLTVPGILLGMIVVINAYYPLAPSVNGFLAGTFILFVILLARLFSPRQPEGAFEDISATVTGVFYIAVLFGFQVMIRLEPDGKEWLVFMYLVIWASDIGAYYIGTLLGKHSLYKRISPKKTVEGFAGALVSSIGVALLCRAWFMNFLSPSHAVVLGFLLAVAGTLGDLVESLFKRSVGVKDSGNLIPGHGGMLDRMDSMLFAAPVLYYYFRLP